MQFSSFAPIILDLILILIFILLRIYINCKHKTNLYQYSSEFIYKNEISRFGLSPSRTCNQWTNIIQTEGLNINFRDFQIRNFLIQPYVYEWTTFYPDHTDRNWSIKLVSLYTAGKEMSGFYKKIFIYYVIYIVYIV